MRTNYSQRRYEDQSPYSGTTALVEARHTSGRRSVQRFNLPNQLDRTHAHLHDLSMQLRRAIRLGRMEKQLVLAEQIHLCKMRSQGLATTITERSVQMPLGKSKQGGRILLDLSHIDHTAWGPKRDVFSPEIINHGRIFKFKDE